MNTKAKQNMAHGKKEGIGKEPKRGRGGEYSTISRENNVCNNSREIKDFILLPKLRHQGDAKPTNGCVISVKNTTPQQHKTPVHTQNSLSFWTSTLPDHYTRPLNTRPRHKLHTPHYHITSVSIYNIMLLAISLIFY